jgi:ElaB/YqjD/DUF883 family membrane-anchored ribosome-binding protein
MHTLSAAQRPFFYDSLEHTIDRSRSAARTTKRSATRTANRTASAAHHVVDALADQALTGVGKVSGSLHIAVNQAADAVIHTADWVAQVPVQVRRKRTKIANAAFATVRARPFLTLGSAIAVGYIIGHMARR